MVWRGLSARRATRRSWFLEALEGKTLLATFVVTSTNAGGAGSLLVAIQNANSTPGLDTIAFGIGSGVQTIRPSAALPTITEPVVIDGTTQPGYGGAPLIELDGSLAGAGASGLTITGGGTTVRGLVINRFGGNGIQITNAGGNALAGNYLGTDVAGTLDRGNGLDGVSIDNSANNIVGGVAPAERNVISGNNAHGVRIYGGSANNNVIQGNTIGLNAAGTAAIGNTINGIVIDNGADNNLVGGTSPGARNVVSGNLEAGVEIQDGSSTGNRIEGNIIGLNAAGTAAIGNLDGVVIKDSPNNTVGGTTTAHRNIISGNTGGSQGNGVVVFGTNATGNLVQNNFIGTDLTGRLDLGNARSGVLISDNGDGGSFKGAAAANTVRDNVLSGNNYAGVGIANFGVNSNLILGNFIGVDASGTGALGNSVFGVVIWNGANGNRIGGITPGAGNVIAYNDRGVIVDANSRSSVNNSIRGNSIHDNAVLGIDLNNDGVSQNDLGDFDRGPNNTRNYPVITSGVVIGTNLTLAGTLNTIPFLNCNLDFYWSPVGDPSGHGEGQTYIGTANVTTDFFGNARFNRTFVGVAVPVGAVITSTATDVSNNTSEFSVNFSVVSGNRAPVLSGSNPLTTINEDDQNSSGTLVSDLIAGKVTDPDSGALVGIAVTAVDDINGPWQYTADGGATWALFGAPTTTRARLLAAAPNSRVRFVPNSDWSGSASLTFRAWDQTSGTAGGTADTSTNGGSSAFSTAVANSGVTVNPVNDAPVRTAGTVNNLTVLENSGVTTLGLGALAYGPGGGADEAGQTLTYMVTAMPPAALGNIVLADGVTVVTANTNYSLGQLQGMRFQTASNANGGPATFSWAVKDSGGIANGGVDTLGESLSISVTYVNQTPTVAASASATPNPVTATTTNLAALGGDDGGEANLTYTWIVAAKPAGATNPTFSVNTGNVAKATTAAFSKAGNYTFLVTITDAGGLSTTSSVNVTVNQTLTTIGVSPPAVTLNENQTQAFSAVGFDQFGSALGVQPSFTWAKAGGVGSINAGGLYTAPAATGPATITATSGSVTGSAAVTVVMISQDVFVDTTSDVVDGDTASLANLLAARGSDGRVSLREAILAADNSAGLNRILFNIPDNDLRHFYYRDDSVAGSLSAIATTSSADASITDFDPDYPYAQHSWFQIDLNLAGPELRISNQVIIDGYSQPGATPNTRAVGDDAVLRIELTCTAANGNSLLGSNRGLAIVPGGSGSTIRGLVINRFPTSGILIEPGADGNTIEGNFLGTDVTGAIALGNGDDGIQVRTSGNVVGGATPGARNLISGNADRGLNFFTFSGTADNNVVENNYFGLDATGTRPLGNAAQGVVGYNLSNSFILNNVISANAKEGIWLRTNKANGNTIQGNLIGTDASGNAALGNFGDGILLDINNGPNNNTVGGLAPGQGNTIAWNAGKGVVIGSGKQNAILGNAIFGNTGLGIDLGDDGVTPNDGAVNGSLPNRGVDFPVFTSAGLSGGVLSVVGFIGLAPGDTLFAGDRVEIFQADNDPSGFGQGRTFLGSLTADAFGNFSGSLSAVGLSVGDKITGTTTDASGNTSEFSATFGVIGLFPRTTTLVASVNPSAYGESVTFTATVSPSILATGSVTFLDGTSVLGTSSLSGGIATFTTSTLSAGIHGVTARYDGDPLYPPGTSAPLNQTVTPAPLRVTADPASKVYGQANPSFTAGFAGFVNGDTVGSLGGTLGFATTATAASAVGAYAVTPGGPSSANYSITYVDGSLAVNPAALTVSADVASKVYGASLSELTYTYSGLVNGDTTAVFSGALSTTAAAGSGVGAYGVSQGTLSAGLNYAITFSAGALAVTPAGLTITANDAVKGYGQPNPSFSASYVGLVNGNAPSSFGGTLGFSTPATAASPVGPYPLTPGGLTSPDYVITFSDGTLTVEPLSLASSGSTIAAVEGIEFSGVVATFVSPDPTPRAELYTAVIRWGDGRASAGVVAFDAARGVYTVEGINTFQAEGVFAVQVTLRAGGAVAATADGVAVVTDAPLIVTGRVFSPTAGEEFAGAVATFLDANPSGEPSDFSVTIDWGDGGTSLGTVVRDDGGGFLTFGTHTFASSGSFKVAITVGDRDGSRASAEVEVGVVAPTTMEGPGTPAGPRPESEDGRASTNGDPIAVTFIGGLATTPPPFSFASGVGPVHEPGPTISGPGGTPVIPSPGVLGPGPVVAPAISSGSGSAPGGADGANATGEGSIPGVLQAAIEFVLGAASRQVDALLGALARADATPTVRGAIPALDGIEARTARADLALPSSYLWGQLDNLDKQVSSGEAPLQVAQVVGTGVVAYAGYMLLNSRVGYLLLSVLTAKPLWGQVDPLAVLLDWEKDEKRKTKSPDDEETLQSLIQKNQERERDEEDTPHDAPQSGAHEPDGQPPVRRSRGRALSRPRRRRTQGTPSAL